MTSRLVSLSPENDRISVKDLYPRFSVLASKERFGIDYRFWFVDRGTPVTVLAPHGGQIEPGTSRIAEAIADGDISIYVFEGLRRRSRELHITSTNFDEPKCLQLVTGTQTAIAIHGRKDRSDPKTVLIGGRNRELRNAIASSLNEAGFEVASGSPNLAASEIANICNRGLAGAGVQLELPKKLRDQLIGDRLKMQSFANAIRAVILHRPEQEKAGPGSGPG